MIPESYVPDLHLRMALYRRLGESGRNWRDRRLRRRNDRPLRPAADRGPASLEDRLHQGALPHRQCREARCRPEGRRHHVLPQSRVRPTRPAWSAIIAKQGTLAKIRPWTTAWPSIIAQWISRCASSVFGPIVMPRNRRRCRLRGQGRSASCGPAPRAPRRRAFPPAPSSGRRLPSDSRD
jgi:hypothetical protein